MHWLQHTSSWQSRLLEQRRSAKSRVPLRLVRARVLKDTGKIVDCCYIFAEDRTNLLGQRRPSANLILVPWTRPLWRNLLARSLRQGGPSARRWRPTSVLALLARALGAAGKPARLPRSLELRVGILINKRVCQCEPGAPRCRGAET